MRHFLFSLFLIFPCILIASPKDSVKIDTIVLPDSVIHLIGIRCSSPSTIVFNKDIQQPRCINSQDEFNDFFNNGCTADSDIDFNKNTLLWFPTSGNGGCEFLRSVKVIGDKVIYNILLIRHTGLMNLIISNNSILIPKINKYSTVDFTVTKSDKTHK